MTPDTPPRSSASPAPASPPTGVLLGVDVGGSLTRAVLSLADLVVRGRTQGPGAPMRPGGGARTAAVIADASQRAAREAKLDLPADAAVVGAAGAGSDDEQTELAAAIRDTGVARRVRVLADAQVALTAAFEAGAGVLLNAGTGTIAFARDPSGQLHRSGGYGWQMGDEGSGYWLGRRALEAAGRAFDGREESSTLLARILGTLSLGTLDDLVRWSVTATPAQVASLAPQLLQAARDGEAVARRAVDEAAAELAALVQALGDRFPGDAPVPVATTGSLLTSDSPLAPALNAALARRMPRARRLDVIVDAPRGALRLARAMMEER